MRALLAIAAGLVFWAAAASAQEAAAPGPAEDGPIVLIELLKFHEKAQYPDDMAEAPDISGADAYAKYGELVRPLSEAAGGKRIWSGRYADTLRGDPEKADDYDTIIVVEFPSLKAVEELTASPDYGPISVHRQAAVARDKILLGRPAQ